MMKTILAVLFSTAMGAACAKTDGSAAVGATECDCKNVKCGGAAPKDAELCVAIGEAGFCGADLAKIVTDAKECTKKDGSAATDANCICGTKTAADLDTAAKVAALKVCIPTESCNVDKCDAKKADGNSATMITAFATIMTTAFFSF